MIYLDYAATTPISRLALDVYNEVATGHFGNTESLHDIGDQSKRIVAESRRQLAAYVNGQSDGIYFTSGGSESNFLALTSLARSNERKGKHLITTMTEHKSVLQTFEFLEKEGFRTTKLPVDSAGQVSLETLRGAIEQDTILVSIGHANSEIGTLQPLSEIGRFLKKKNILFHSDCVQTFGKLPIDVGALGLDSISMSAHKVYGPKGVGACYISPDVSWKPFLSGTQHEKGFRAGTLNVPGIASFVTAAGEVVESMGQQKQRFGELRKQFLQSLEDGFDFVVEGHPVEHLLSILGIRVKGIEGQLMMLEMNRKGFAISTGSACSVGSQKPSNTMLMIGRSDDEARELIRLSFGNATTADEVEAAAKALSGIYRNVKRHPVR